MPNLLDRGAQVALEHGAGPRSHHWPTVEHEVRAKNPDCFACPPGSPFEHVGLQVHHCFPYHFVKLAGRPDLELDERNLVVAGETEHGSPAPDHHELIAHGGNFKSYNPNARADALVFMGMDTAAIKADPRWATLHANLPKLWPELTTDEKILFRRQLDSSLPPDPIVVGRFPDAAPVPFEVWVGGLAQS